jgi:hypothetical protein
MSFLGCASGDSTTANEEPSGSGGSAAGGSGGATTTTTKTKPQVCAPGAQIECACPGGAKGVQDCKDDGTGYTKCQGCEAAGGSGTGGSGGAGGQLPCGDKVCADDESCHTCELDCGPCKPCLDAPSCDNSQIPPMQLDHVPQFDVPKMIELGPAEILERLRSKIAARDPGAIAVAAALEPKALPNENSLVTMLRGIFAANPRHADALRRSLKRAGATPELIAHPELLEIGDPGKGLGPMKPLGKTPPGGTVECGAPLLRVRVARVTVWEEDDDWANDIVYCAVQSEAASASEIVVTPETPNLDQGEHFDFSIQSGIFWGQKQPTSPGGNLMITYDCFEDDSSSGYQKLLDSISQGAIAVGGSGVAGAYGWVFTAVGAVAGIVSSGLALDGDDHLFNANQIIPLASQLELTNGRYWTVRRAGTHNLSDWDWELRIEAWGCAEYGEKDKVDAGAPKADGGADAGDGGK